jgi:hypothetical protein
VVVGGERSTRWSWREWPLREEDLEDMAAAASNAGGRQGRSQAFLHRYVETGVGRRSYSSFRKRSYSV